MRKNVFRSLFLAPHQASFQVVGIPSPALRWFRDGEEIRFSNWNKTDLIYFPSRYNIQSSLLTFSQNRERKIFQVRGRFCSASKSGEASVGLQVVMDTMS